MPAVLGAVDYPPILELLASLPENIPVRDGIYSNGFLLKILERVVTGDYFPNCLPGVIFTDTALDDLGRPWFYFWCHEYVKTDHLVQSVENFKKEVTADFQLSNLASSTA